MIDISDAAIEAGAREAHQSRPGAMSWDSPYVGDAERQFWRDRMRAGLTAGAPIVESEDFADLADDLNSAANASSDSDYAAGLQAAVTMVQQRIATLQGTT